MYKAVFLFALVAAVSSAPAEEVPIISQEMNIDPEGGFHWSYKSGDGTKVVQDGSIKQLDKDTAVQSLEGSYEYKGDDGKVYSLTYTADENGYVPQGSHLPLAPLVPDLILKALRYLATAPPPTA